MGAQTRDEQRIEATDHQLGNACKSLILTRL